MCILCKALCSIAWRLCSHLILLFMMNLNSSGGVTITRKRLQLSKSKKVKVLSRAWEYLSSLKSFPAYRCVYRWTLIFKAFMLLFVLLNIKVDDSLYDRVLQTDSKWPTYTLTHHFTRLHEDHGRSSLHLTMQTLLRFNIRSLFFSTLSDFESGNVVWVSNLLPADSRASQRNECQLWFLWTKFRLNGNYCSELSLPAHILLCFVCHLPFSHSLSRKFMHLTKLLALFWIM